MTTTSHPTPSLYFNRELSWLEFNARVLHEAFDERNPLLERLKFLAIYSTNLDEFYMVRVAGLRRQVAAGVTHPGPDGIPPAEALDAIHARVAELEARRDACLHELLLPALAAKGIRLCRMDELSQPEWLTVDDFFESQVFPVLTPLAVDPGHPFPYISNLSLSLAVRLRDPERKEEQFARVKVPKSLPRWVPFGRPHHFVPLEEVIGANLGALFPGMEIVGWHPFRVTRYSDLDLGSIEENQDLLSMIEQQVFRRRFGEVVRLEVAAGMPDALRELLADELRDATQENIAPLGPRDVHVGGALLELGDLMALAGQDLPELRDPPHTPGTVPALQDNRSIFDVIRERDILLHHPVDSFVTSVEAFLDEAASDPNVLAIKLTLYRTSGDTAIVRALTEAAQNGKQVAVLVELQARFDEANNITWARTLESHGVHVTYGLPGLKTHCKTALVVRREADGIRRYCHIGTGNYNSKTARLYTDIGLLTCSPSIGADLSDLFNLLTGYSRQKLYRKLLVAPSNMKGRFLELIQREREHARAGRGGRIIVKMNALVHEELIDALYAASQDGVEIDCIVRGICCLRPGLDGVSDRIRVQSVIGRFLEHSRVFFFANGGSPEYYIGSADWMPRNLERRVEVVTPVEDATLHPRLQRLLEIYLGDNRQAWDLRPDGSYVQRRPKDGEKPRGTHQALIRDAWGMGRITGQFPAIERDGAAEAPAPASPATKPTKRRPQRR
ncbi:MAG: polyphosphate kinase 1 [Gemmatimonadaceae bacterium]|jgi:polyphosphate kinase|nr:polyphosphate kinase 1 [Gemmatimonadaceae bacterium]